MVTSAAIGMHDLLWAERADAGRIAEITSIARMLYPMHYTRIPVMPIRDRGLPFHIQTLFWS